MPRIAAKTCNHASGPVRMQRIYERVNGRFIPIAWRCPDCRQVRE